MNPQLITLSHATYVGPSGATAAATARFFTSDYQPAAQERAIDTDVVINANGAFKYVYDNGPGFRKWNPFNIHCEDKFQVILGLSATQQYAELLKMWRHPGNLGMVAPDGTYIVHWSDSVDVSFRTWPVETGSAMEFRVQVQFEESQ